MFLQLKVFKKNLTDSLSESWSAAGGSCFFVVALRVL